MEKEVLIDREIDNSLDDESIYSEDVRNALVDDDEISPFEEAFMKGYEEAIEWVDVMQRMICISCGFVIKKSALHDPYLCRECENLMVDTEERYAYLDHKVWGD